MKTDPDSYDAGYKQALIDVSKFIRSTPLPEMAETTNMKDFWNLLKRAGGNDTSKFNIFTAGFRVAKRELSEKIEKLSKNI